MNTLRVAGTIAIVTLLAMVTLPVSAGTFSGSIKDSGGSLMQGVMVRVSHADSGMSETKFSDTQGNFRLSTVLMGPLHVRLRTPYYRDVEIDIDLGSDAEINRTLVMEAMTGDVEISDSLPAAYHFGNLAFETGDDAPFNRYQFQRDCLSCHQLGNAYTRAPRSPDRWHQTIVRMHRYMGGKYDSTLRQRRSVILSEGFNGKPISVRPEFPLDPSLSDATIYEYRLSRGNPHDAIVHPQTGIIYSADQVSSHFAVTDTRTGKSEYVSQSGNGNRYRVPGSATGEINNFSSYTRNAPHSMALGPDGKYYVTNTATNTIGVFNPQSNEWEPSYVIGGGARYPHTIRVDKEGIAWFTISGSEMVGRLDPVSGESTVIRLPYAASKGGTRGTWTYGIDIHPEDGTIWYGRLFADRIGRIDPKTLEVTEFDSPVRGPRRMRFDSSGVLWVAGFAEGTLARIQPTADGFDAKVYRMPEFAAGDRPAPYALGVHPQSQEIWLNVTMTDRLYRFIPSEERFVAYPVPLRGTYTRDFSFTPDGKACTSNNPFPLASLEGGVSEILCIKLN
jgi:streptogramin lyase